MKACCACGANLPLGEFHKDVKSPDGRVGMCKACACARARKWREENRERARASARARYATDPGPQKERALRNYYANPEPKKAYVREYRKTYDVGEVRQRRLERSRERYQEQIEYERERSKRYYEGNRYRWRGYHAARRAVQGADTPEVQTRVRALLDEPCVYCGAVEPIEIDHIVPLSRGGTHTPENLAPACRPCNRSKGARLVSEWRVAA